MIPLVRSAPSFAIPQSPRFGGPPVFQISPLLQDQRLVSPVPRSPQFLFPPSQIVTIDGQEALLNMLHLQHQHQPEAQVVEPADGDDEIVVEPAPAVDGVENQDEPVIGDDVVGANELVLQVEPLHIVNNVFVG